MVVGCSEFFKIKLLLQMLFILLEWYVIAPLLLALFYWHGTRNFSHWKNHGVKYIPPVFFFGNIRKRVLFQASFHEIQKEFYFSFPGERIAGRSCCFCLLSIVKDLSWNKFLCNISDRHI